MEDLAISVVVLNIFFFDEGFIKELGSGSFLGDIPPVRGPSALSALGVNRVVSLDSLGLSLSWRHEVVHCRRPLFRQVGGEFNLVLPQILAVLLYVDLLELLL